GKNADSDKQADCNRKIERGSRFSSVAGGQRHGDPPRRQRESGIRQSRRDALAALFYFASGKPNGRPIGQTAGDVDLDANVVRLNAGDSSGADGGKHAATLRQSARTSASFECR